MPILNENHQNVNGSSIVRGGQSCGVILQLYTRIERYRYSPKKIIFSEIVEYYKVFTIRVFFPPTSFGSDFQVMPNFSHKDLRIRIIYKFLICESFHFRQRCGSKFNVARV